MTQVRQEDLYTLKYSKHFLVRGWGLKEQDRAGNILVAYPTEWNLFESYLHGMGNRQGESSTSRKYDLRCSLVQSRETSPDRTPDCHEKFHFEMLGVVGENLVISLKDQEKVIKTWSYALPNQTASSELVQLSFFLSVTDSIKSGIL